MVNNDSVTIKVAVDGESYDSVVIATGIVVESSKTIHLILSLW
jgi:hypothetical protein